MPEPGKAPKLSSAETPPEPSGVPEVGTAPEPFSLVDNGDAVVRFVPAKDAFIPPGAKFPSRKAFEPSTEDKEEALQLGRPVAISVWNRRHTTIAEARTLILPP